MSNIEFFNVKDKDLLVVVKKTKSAFHTRRGIIVQDDDAKTLWIVYGSLASDKIKKFAKLNAKSLNSKLKFSYKIKTVDSKNRKEKIEYFMDLCTTRPPAKNKKQKKAIAAKKKSGSPTKKGKKKSTVIPPVNVPPKLKKRTRSLVKADEKNVGPMIPEFQIAYYEENPLRKIIEQINLVNSDDDLFALHDHISTIVQLINENASKKRVHSELQTSVEQLLNALFE